MATDTFYGDTNKTSLSPVPTGTIPLGDTSTQVTASSLAPTTPLTLPQPPADATSSYSAALSSIPSVNDLSQTLTKGSTLQDNQRAFGSQLLSVMQKLGERTGAQIQAENAAGLPTLNKSLTDVNGQIQSLQKEALAIPLQLQQQSEGRGITEGGLAPIQTGLLRQNAIKSLSLSSIAQTLQGNIALAQQQANRAVDLEFAPYQAQLDYLTKAYEINKDALNREDSKRATIFQAQLQDRQTQLNQAKEDRQTIIALANAAVKNFPNDPQAQYAAQQALGTNDLQAAYQFVGKYQSDPNATAKTLADIQQTRAQTAYYQAQAAKIANDAAATGSTATNQNRSSAVNLVNSLLNDNQLANATGNFLQRPNFLASHISGTPVQNTLNNLKQLSGILALENRQQLKGQGQISDFEGKTLDRAASSLGIDRDSGMSNLSYSDLQYQLKQVRGVLTTMSGQPALVTVTDSKGNTSSAQADSDQITAMIRDGLQVQYQ